MDGFNNSETKKNLRHAFIEEAVTYTKYRIFAQLAKQQGEEAVSRFFQQAADNEKEHAKIWMKWFCEGKYPEVGKTIEHSLSIEKEEGSVQYPEFARIAREEGYEHIAELFRLISDIEKEHENTLKKLALSRSNTVDPNSDGTFDWECSVCGCALRQTERPDFCPVCENEDVFFFNRQR